MNRSVAILNRHALLKLFYSNKKLIRIAVYSILTVLVIVTVIPQYLKEVKPGLINTYVFQADAFLHGKLAVGDADELGCYELSLFEGKKYVCLPPFPAVLLMPFVAIWGVKTHVTVIGLFLALFSAFILKKILEQLQIEKEKIPWLLCAFILGTAYWWCVHRSGAPWLTAQVIAIACILLAIHEALGKGRGFLTGTFLGMAMLSRQLSVYSAIFLCCALWNGGANGRITSNRKRAWNIGFFFLGAGIWILTYLAFNWARFGNPFDTGYAYIQFDGFLKERTDQHGLFSLAYVPFNFTYMFLQGFHVVFGGEDMLTIKRLDVMGTAITFASPFIFYAFRARWNKLLHIGAWTTITLCLFHMLLYHNNGWYQVNCQRFTLDFMPVLMLLVALGIAKAKSNLWKYAIIYAVALNTLAYFIIPGIINLREFLSR
jgi:hypothetical protein